MCFIDDEVSPDINKDCEVTIAIRCGCNYKCSYCVSNNIKDIFQEIDLQKIETIYKNLNAGFVLSILECGASEPSIHPRMKELLSLISDFGMISIPTNNSIDCDKWLPKEKANHFYIRCALHEQSEKKLDGFLGRVDKIKEYGAHLCILYVARPDRIDKIDQYKLLFKDHKFIPYPFVGIYEEKNYPEAYSEKEREILGLNNQNTAWLNRLFVETNIRNFKGIPCFAGNRSIYIDPEGNLRRCFYDTKILNNVLKKPAPCVVDNCGCGFLLEELNTLDVFFFNTWRRFLNLPVYRDPRTSDEIFCENKAKYWELMERYKKL